MRELVTGSTCHMWECGLYVRPGNVVICKILECGLYVRSWNVGYMSDLGMWAICKILACGLYIRSWTVG